MLTIKNNSQNINPEWKEPKGLVLVYPKDIRNKLVNVYKEFIKVVTKETKIPEITLIVRPTAIKDIDNYIIKCNLNIQTNIHYFETESVQDIWVRDFAPIYFSNGIVFKALYKPSYFKEKEINKYAELDNQTGLDLANYLELKINTERSNLILDGGNFINNGQGSAIVTNRVIRDNETLSICEIKHIFKKQLNISNLIFLPVEPSDMTGHIDGMVRFVDEQTVIVGSYPDKYEKSYNIIDEEDYKIGKIFLDKIAYTLNKTFKVIRIENSIPINEETNGIASAYGNYINYLRIGNKILIPHYGKLQDNKAIETFKKHFPCLKIIPINTEILSKYGGVLNCISWTYY